MDKDKISIILPVYNSEQYIEETIESIKNQTYENWELIIVDDASTDKSREIIKKCINKKINLVELEINQGVSICRNKGTELASGRYICFIDSDDIWKKDKLEKELKFMKQNNVNFCFSGFEYVKHNNFKRTKIVYVPKSLNYRQALKNTIILTSTVMIDTKHINKELIYMPNVRRGQDTATWWQILKNDNIAYGLNESLVYYRVRPQSISYNKIKALKRTWNLYRNIEGFGVLKSWYYFNFYAFNATKKRII